MKKYIYLLTLLFLVISCDTSKKDVDVSAIQVTAKISRIDLELPKCKSVDEVMLLLDNNPGFTDGLIDAGILPNKKIMAEQLFMLGQDPKFKELFDEVAKELGDLSATQTKVTDLYKHIKYYLPKFEEPTVYMFISGFGGFGENYLGKKGVIFGSEYFLENKGKYYPKRAETPFYMHRHFVTEKIPTKLSNILAEFQFANYDQKDKTLINEMIRWGKIYYFTEYMVPTAPDSLIIEYTPDEMARVEANKKETYGYFAKNDLLFNEEKAAQVKFVAPRPTTNEIGDKAPGRVGRYLGWEIVRAYMKANPEVTIEELMKDMDHQAIFRKARYKP